MWRGEEESVWWPAVVRFPVRKFDGQRFLRAGGFDAGDGIRRTCCR